jgi:hypothetical protein
VVEQLGVPRAALEAVRGSWSSKSSLPCPPLSLVPLTLLCLLRSETARAEGGCSLIQRATFPSPPRLRPEALNLFEDANLLRPSSPLPSLLSPLRRAPWPLHPHRPAVLTPGSVAATPPPPPPPEDGPLPSPSSQSPPSPTSPTPRAVPPTSPTHQAASSQSLGLLPVTQTSHVNAHSSSIGVRSQLPLPF